MRNRISRLIPTGIVGGGAVASPLLTGLIDYWKLDETSGNRLDSVGTRHFVPQATIGSAAGKIGNCVTASGTGNFLAYNGAELTSIDWAAGFSIVGWLYVPSTYSGRNTILTKGDNSAADWLLYTNAVNATRMWVNDSSSGSSFAEITTTLNVDTWYFVAGRYNPATKKSEVRLNDSAWTISTSALTNGPLNIKGSLRVANFSGLYGNAYYDEIGLWTRYLTNEEVEALYAAGAGATHPF